MESLPAKTVISKYTTDTYLSNVDFFRPARIFLRIFGIWPLDYGRLPIRFYINFVSLFFAATFGLAHGFVNLADLYVALESFCACLFEFISWCKCAIVFYYRKEFAELLKRLLIYYNQDYKKDEIAIYRKTIIYTTVGIIFLASGGISTCSIYVVTPIIKNTFYFFTNHPLVKELPFKAVYPFIDSYSDNWFLPCYIHLTHGGYCTAFVFNGIDSIFITTCFHISAQFQIKSMRIQNIFKRLKHDGPFTAIANKSIRVNLIEVVEEQIQLFDLTDLFINVFTWIILMHFISVALIIGVGSINLLMSSGSAKVLYIAYIVTVVTQSYAYAYSGDQINEHSLDICSAVWNSDWHCLDLKNQKLVSMLILRSQKAKFIKVPFFEVTLNAFARIMSTAGSYITLLNNMLNK